MKQVRTLWQRHPGTRLAILVLALILMGSSGIEIPPACTQPISCIAKTTALVVGTAMGIIIPIGQGVENIVVLGPEVCGEILRPNEIQIQFLAPYDPSSFYIEKQIQISAVNIETGGWAPPLSLGNPIFSGNQMIITLPIIQESVTIHTRYTVKLKSNPVENPLKLKDGHVLDGEVPLIFSAAPADSISPYIASYSQGTGYSKGARNYTDYIKIVGIPVEFQNIPPHQKDLEIVFSEKMHNIMTMPSRGNPIDPRVTLPPPITLTELSLNRLGDTRLFNSSSIVPYWPGVLYQIGFNSCTSACEIIKDCSSGTTDVTGMWLSPYDRSTATDPACLFNSDCEITLSKQDTVLAFTTAKVRIDSTGWCFPQGGGQVLGIASPDIGTVSLSIVGKGVNENVTTQVGGLYNYNTWNWSFSDNSDWEGLEDGAYELRAIAPDGGYDKIGIIKDTQVPTVSITDVNPSYMGYVSRQFTVGIQSSDVGCGVVSEEVRVTNQRTGKTIPFAASTAQVELPPAEWSDGDIITIQAFAWDWAGNQGASAYTTITA